MKCELFDGLSDTEVRALTENPACRELCFEKGEIIFDPQHFSNSIGLILSGAAIVSSFREDVLMRRLGEGACFGVASVFGTSADFVTRVTAAGKCTVMFIPRGIISDALKACPRLAENYIRFLTGRIRYLNTLVGAYSSPSAETRLARFLTALDEGKDVPLTLSLTELSKALGIGRASLYRALDSFESRGLIKRNGKQITLADPDELKKI